MSSSLEKFNIDFSHLSFDSSSPVLDLESDRQQISQQAPQAALKRPGMTPRSTSRNKQCMPSDDEDEEDEDEDEEQDSDNEINNIPRGGVQKLAISTPSMTKPMRKSRPLPSDDEDSEEEQDEDKQQGAGGVKQHTTSLAGGNKLHPNGNHAYQDYAGYMQYQSYQQEQEDDDDDDRALVTNPNAGPILTLVEGTHLQQLHQKQQQHQAQLAQFQYQQQQQQLQQHYYHQNHPHHPHQQQQHPKSRGNVSMSGMDLLKQLEQEKADSKRIKPKLDTSKVKIEGLLGKLPEPGSHNISFQQIQQQQQHQHRKKNQYLDPFTLEKSRSPSPSRNSHRISHTSKQ
ncbi:hypothetical protein MAM1_0112d05591 [Mucor ambiguus]|uniref:Uncharacterized protein n=1 Tax=Mucor ambiguus TaxID=91626 RepID=A0A0C9MFR9_9FUNG|nr:hypothetical protein MAM1_0112d05591 [Mucor ambiguus]